jgi:hypothetical protein
MTFKEEFTIHIVIKGGLRQFDQNVHVAFVTRGIVKDRTEQADPFYGKSYFEVLLVPLWKI